MLTNQGGALPGGVESFMTWPVADWAIGLELRAGEGAALDGHRAVGARGARTSARRARSASSIPPTASAAALLCNRGTYSGWMLAPGGWPDIVAAIVSGD